MVELPRLYAIVDADFLRERGVGLREFCLDLRAGGVELVQWRDKTGAPQVVLAGAAVLSEVFSGTECRLMMNDRADLAVLAGFDGVHVGQGDLSPEDARTVLGGARVEEVLKKATCPSSQDEKGWATQILSGGTQLHTGRDLWVGVSTHNDEQVRVAELSCADYVAVGPVFATATKVDTEPVIGLEGVRRVRELTGKSLVAIGGITRENARSVMDAGADSVAVISGLMVAGESVAKVVGDFLGILR